VVTVLSKYISYCRPNYQQPFDLPIYFYINTLNLTILRSGQQNPMVGKIPERRGIQKSSLHESSIHVYRYTPFMNKFRILISCLSAPVAQWIEQWIPNPCAASSILAGGTNNFKYL
jgi:hypothetical protein